MADQLEAAWTADTARRERIEGLLFAMLAGGLNPIWIAFDAVVVPELLAIFVSLRAVNDLILGVCAFTLWKTTDPHTIRVATRVAFFTTLVAIGAMLPMAGDGYFAYVLGYSLIILGGGALFTRPVARAVPLFAMGLVSHLVAHALLPGHPIEEVAASAIYLGSAAVIGVTTSALRYGLHQQAFEATFELEQRHAELLQTQAKLVASEKLSALGRLMAGLSHEINNPMNVIANSLGPLREYASAYEAVLAGHEAGLDVDELEALREHHDLDFVREDVHDALDTMQEAVDRIQDVHVNLRTFVRGGAADPQPCDVNAGVEATVRMLRRSMPPEIEVEAHYGSLEPVIGRLGELNQVVFNLLQNSVDAMGERGQITVRTQMKDGLVEVRVADTGPGVSDSVAPRLFEPFFTTKGAQGTGLGLSMCHQIVSRLGGVIAHEPRPDGALFVVQLPPAQPSS